MTFVFATDKFLSEETLFETFPSEELSTLMSRSPILVRERSRERRLGSSKGERRVSKGERVEKKREARERKRGRKKERETETEREK